MDRLPPSPSRSYDVIVYGGTAGGVVAAVAAAAEGAVVALVEPGRPLGGMVSGGLGYSDLGQRDVVGGRALAVYEAVARHYGTPLWVWAGPEPHVAEGIFRDWLGRAQVDVHLGRRIEGVAKGDASIERLVVHTGETFDAAVFVDASYEGDVMAAAGVSYAVGRESRRTHGESWAGRQPLRPGKHDFDVVLSPFRDDDERELLPLVHDRPLAEVGEGDGAVQGYGFRVCLTRDPDNRLPIPEPDEPMDLELLRRYVVAKGDSLRAGALLGLAPNLPGDKCDANSLGPLSLNLLDGSNWAYPDADPQAREAIRRRHLHWAQNFLYFLNHDDSVPRGVRDELRTWGLCRDEFGDTGGWPHQLYVREARRMRGEYVMTQHDLNTGRRKYDAVGMGSYHIDVRHTQRVWQHLHLHPRLVPAVANEGYMSVPVEPYQIPYRSLVPRYHECDNLLVPVCVSASHVAFASIRMEPQYMILGHAAGTAAALAARRGVPVQRVDVTALQTRLREERQVLSLASRPPPGPSRPAPDEPITTRPIP